MVGCGDIELNAIQRIVSMFLLAHYAETVIVYDSVVWIGNPESRLTQIHLELLINSS